MRDTIAGVVLSSCEQEQAWNQDQLNQTVSRPLARLWSYREPGVVLGCAQSNAVMANEVKQRTGMEVVGRQAGGGAVLAGPWMLSTSVVLPNTHPLVSGNRLVESYRWIGEMYATVLQELGIGAHAISPDEARLQQQSVSAGLGWACFAGFSPWEVVVGRRKIVGLAQVRRRTGTLFVAGLLLSRPDWRLLSGAMGKEESCNAELADCTTSCTEQLGRALALEEVALPLAHALNSALDLP
jgi:lipoate-protein ligase A